MNADKLISAILYILMIIEIILLFTSFRFRALEEQRESDKIDLIEIANVMTVKEPKVTVDTFYINSREWLPFRNIIPKWDTLDWSAKLQEEMTDRLYLESTSCNNIHDERDRYMVMFCAVNKYLRQDRYRKGSVYHKKKGKVSILGLFRYPYKSKRRLQLKTQKERTLWMQCKQVVTNIVNCSIPNYIPYHPGFYYYGNHDGNGPHKRMCEDRCILVAVDAKGHCFYADPYYMTQEELQHIQQAPCCSLDLRLDRGFLCDPSSRKRNIADFENHNHTVALQTFYKKESVLLLQ